MKFTLKQAKPEDAEAIYELLAADLEVYENFEKADHDKVMGFTHRKVKDYIDRYTCIMDGENKAGYFLAQEDEGFLVIQDFVVTDGYVGSEIYEEVIDLLEKKTELPLEVHVFTGNIDALSMYRALGFELDSTMHGTRYKLRRKYES